MKSKNYSTSLGDEGGFAPDLSSNEEPIEVIMEAIKEAGYKAGDDHCYCSWCCFKWIYKW